MLHDIFWIVVLVMAVLAFATGAVTIRSQQVALPWLRGRMQWRRWGWGTVAFGLFLVLEGVLRLVGFSAGWEFALSGIALLPLAIGLILNLNARVPRS